MLQQRRGLLQNQVFSAPLEPWGIKDGVVAELTESFRRSLSEALLPHEPRALASKASHFQEKSPYLPARASQPQQLLLNISSQSREPNALAHSSDLSLRAFQSAALFVRPSPANLSHNASLWKWCDAAGDLQS